jgi:hypothetical protein
MLVGSLFASIILTAIILIRQRKEYVYFVLLLFPFFGIFIPSAISTGNDSYNLDTASKLYVEISHLQEVCRDRIRDVIYDKTCIGYRAILSERYKEAIHNLISSADTANVALDVLFWPFQVD